MHYVLKTLFVQNTICSILFLNFKWDLSTRFHNENVPVESMNSPNQLNSGYDDIKLSEADTVGDAGTVALKTFPLTCKYYYDHVNM